MTGRNHILLDVLRAPHRLRELRADDWDVVIPQARCALLLGRIAALVRAQDLYGALPGRVQGPLRAAERLAEDNARAIRWEIDRIARALDPLDVPVVLLKGAAYLEADLPLAKGRLMSDLDIMVPRSMLRQVESMLRRHGWEFTKLRPYDQRYYRLWMHELPPLRHPSRRTTVDVHHAILPTTARLRVDATKLWEKAQPLGRARLHVMAPPDLVLHSAAHLFHDGDLRLAIRDLVDIHDLLSRFAREEPFWDDLIQRARELDLIRPLYYALRYAQSLLDTAVPQSHLAAAASAAPARPIRSLMDHLISSTLIPGSRSAGTTLAANLLYLRSHWLRMPPHLLALHLTRKAFMRLAARQAEG